MKEEKTDKPEKVGKPAAQKAAQDEPRLDPAAFWNELSDQPEQAAPDEEEPMEIPRLSGKEPDPEPKPESTIEPTHQPGPHPAPLDASKLAPSARPFRPITKVRDKQRPTGFKTAKPHPSPTRMRIFLGCFLLVLLGAVFWIYFNISGQEDKESDRTNQEERPALSQKDQPDLESVETPDRNNLHQDDPPEPDAIPAQGVLGRISLASDPPGAVVYVNGIRRGVTPTVVKKIMTGEEVKLRMELDGYRTWKHTFFFDKKTLVREFVADLFREITCEHGVGWLHIASEPSGATVELDGKLLPGKTPMVVDQVCTGVQHNLRVLALGHRTWWQSFILRSGEVRTFRARLSR